MTGGPERVRWAVAQLDAQLDAPPDARVLEIGCGPGHAVALLCERFAAVVAIDRSAAAVVRARERNAAHVAAGRARVERAALEEVLRADSLGGPFDAALAVNVNAFWTRPAPALAAARRLLRPGAPLLLVYEPPPGRDRHTLGATIAALCDAHGFLAEVRVQTPGCSVGIVARRG